MADGKTLNGEHKLPAVYLLTTYFSKDNPASKYEPLANTVISTESVGVGEKSKSSPLILRSDRNGKINSLKEGNDLQTRALLHQYSNRPIIIPPPDAVSYLAAAHASNEKKGQGDKKEKGWADELVEMMKTYSPPDAVQPLTLQEVPFEELRKPVPLGKDKDEGDKEYRDWYNNLSKTLDKNSNLGGKKSKSNKFKKSIFAYVIAKMRAAIFVINKTLPVNIVEPSQVTLPNGELVQLEWNDDYEEYYLGIISGTEKQLPTGLYKINIMLNDAEINNPDKKKNENPKENWNSLIQESLDDEPTYTLAEMIKFNITNTAGEFDIINCDPISVEETIIKQYPQFYAHLLGEAQKMKPAHRFDDPEQAANFEDDLNYSGDGKGKKINDTLAAAPAKGFLDYAQTWAVIKEKSELAVGLISTDLSPRDFDLQVNNDHARANHEERVRNLDADIAGVDSDIDDIQARRTAGTALDGDEAQLANLRASRANLETARTNAETTNSGEETTRQQNQDAADREEKSKDRKALAWTIGRALHSHLQTNEDTRVRATLNAVFATKDGIDAWGDFKDARKAYLNAINSPQGLKSWDEALLKKLVIVDKTADIPPAELAKYKRSIAGKMGIPKQALDIFGKAMAIHSLYSSTTAFGKTALGAWKKSYPEKEDAIKFYKEVAVDYFNTLSEKIDVENIVIRSEFTLGTDELADPASKGEITNQVANIVEALDKYERLFVTVTGHTCEVGDADRNMQLSGQRAIAIWTILKDAGVPVGKMRVISKGNTEPLPRGTHLSLEELNTAREQDRRVEVLAQTLNVQDVCPSREGMDTLERYRTLSVQRSLALEDHIVAAAQQATDLALSVMAMIPASAPLAAAIVLAKSAKDAAVSLIAAIDQVANDSRIASWVANEKSEHTMLRESMANQSLLYDLFDGEKDIPKAKAEIHWAAQFRVRAEAIAGLVGLLMRAAVGANEQESYEERVEKYFITEYIQNFLLDDEWNYPLNDLSLLKLDTYWIHAIEDMTQLKRFQSSLSPEAPLTPEQRKEVCQAVIHKAITDVQTGEQVYKTGQFLVDSYIQVYKDGARYVAGALQSHGLSIGGELLTRATRATPAGHITAKYQGYYPIHYLGTKDLGAFAHTFNPIFSNLKASRFYQTLVYYKDADTQQWTPFSSKMSSDGDIDDLQISPFTPIRVLVVFDEDTRGIIPLTFGVVRSDGRDLPGPVYKQNANALALTELLDSEHQYNGMIGSVFYPFFQLGVKTYLGLKPMAGIDALNWYGTAEKYYQARNLSNMTYRITCKIATTGEEPIELPLHSKRDSEGDVIFPNALQATFGSNDKALSMDIPVKIDTEENPAEQSFLIKSYLAAKTTEFTYQKLYDGNKTLRVAIKVGKDVKNPRRKKIPFIAPADQYPGGTIQSGTHHPLFTEEIAATQAATSKLEIEPHGHFLKINGFDWKTPVEFVIVLSCTQLEMEGYQDKSLKMDWKSIPCSVELWEEAMGVSDTVFSSETQGPKLSSSMIYMGKATRKETSLFKVWNGVATSQPDGYAFKPDRGGYKAEVRQVMDILNAKNNADQNQARALLGWEDQRSNDRSKERHVFAAHFTCKYESPKGKEIDSIRPFGKSVYSESGVFFDESTDEYIQYKFKNFKSLDSAKSDVATLEDANGRPYRFYFKTPTSIRSGAPWTEPMPTKKYNTLEAGMSQKEKDLMRTDDTPLSGKQIKQWLENDAQSLKRVSFFPKKAHN